MANLKGGTVIGGYRAVHTGNIVKILTARDGHGSGIDADLLDGRHASDFSLTSHNHDSSYVKKSGDTMTGGLSTSGWGTGFKVIKDNSDVSLNIANNQARIRVGGDGALTNNGFAIQGASDFNLLRLDSSGNGFLGRGGQIVTRGDYGHTKGIDADMLDGIHKDYFIYGINNTGVTNVNSINDIWKSGFYDLDGESGAPVSGNRWWWILKIGHRNNNTNNKYGTVIAGQNGANELYFKNATANGTADWCRIWHSRNQGSNSGLDADMIDGIQSDRIVYGQNNSGTTSISNIDLISKSGFYRPSTITTVANNTLPENKHSGIIHYQNPESNAYSFQIAVPYTGNNRIYFRNKDNNTISQWHRIYHTENKPTPAEVGAVNKAGDTIIGPIHFDSKTASTPNPSYLSLCGYGLYSIASMRFYADTDNGNANNEFLHFAVSEGTTPGRDKGLLIYRDDIKFKNNKIWHAGNDGAGSGLDADMVDGKHWSDIENTFVKKSGDIMTGNLQIKTGSSNALQLYARDGDHIYMSLYPRTNSNTRGAYIGYGSAGSSTLVVNNEIGALQLSSKNNIISMNGIQLDKSNTNPNATDRLNIGAYVHATRFYGAVYNDYAEYFEKDKNEEFEPGDLICLDESSDEEIYIKSKKPYSPNVVGVYSDEYAQCIGGKGDGKDEENYLPIGLAGRVRVKVIGKVSKGDLLVSSGVEGYAMASTKYIPGTVIGKALENKTSIGEGKVRMLINLQ